jgi:hypothetical protein
MRQPNARSFRISFLFFFFLAIVPVRAEEPTGGVQGVVGSEASAEAECATGPPEAAAAQQVVVAIDATVAEPATAAPAATADVSATVEEPHSRAAGAGASLTPAAAASTAFKLDRLSGNCGPLALQRILAARGKRVQLRSLVEQSGSILGRANLAGLVAAARKNGVGAAGVKTDFAGLVTILKSGASALVHFGGNNHFVWIREIDERWVYGYNPAVANSDWKIPVGVFATLWRGDGIVVWDLAISLAGSNEAIPIGLVAALEPLAPEAMRLIIGGDTCENVNDTAGPPPDCPINSNQPVNISNGNLTRTTTDFAFSAVGPDLEITRQYNSQVVSEVEGWLPDDGAGNWSVRNGAYAGRGDRSRSRKSWRDFDATINMQTVRPGSEADWHTGLLNFRMTDAGNRYYVILTTDSDLEVVRIKDWVQIWLMDKQTSYDPRVNHQFRIRTSDSTVQIWVDGNLEIDVADSDPYLASGSIGLEDYFSHAAFDTISVVAQFFNPDTEYEKNRVTLCRRM